MPLKRFFQEHMAALRAFLEDPADRLRVISYDQDIRQHLLKLLLAMEQDEENPHSMLVTQQPFHGPEQFFHDVLEEIVVANEAHRGDLAGAGVTLPRRPGAGPPGDALVDYICAVSRCLPDDIGAFAVIFDPPEIDRPAAFRQAMTRLAEQTPDAWAKYIVLEDRGHPVLVPPPPLPRGLSAQEFFLSPEKIEKQLRLDLERGTGLREDERQRYQAMLGSFAFARGADEEAERLQRGVAEQAMQSGTQAEKANAFYNLGNTCLRLGKLEEAERHLASAAARCLDAGLNALLAMVLANLGVCLNRQQRNREALQSFKAAQETMRAINNRPGEAYLLDCMARIYAAERSDDAAEACWQQALEIYEGITAKPFADIRKAGREDILEKMRHFFAATGQPAKAQKIAIAMGALP